MTGVSILSAVMAGSFSLFFLFFSHFFLGGEDKDELIGLLIAMFLIVIAYFQIADKGDDFK